MLVLLVHVVAVLLSHVRFSLFPQLLLPVFPFRFYLTPLFHGQSFQVPPSLFVIFLILLIPVTFARFPPIHDVTAQVPLIHVTDALFLLIHAFHVLTPLTRVFGAPALLILGVNARALPALFSIFHALPPLFAFPRALLAHALIFLAPQLLYVAFLLPLVFSSAPIPPTQL